MTNEQKEELREVVLTIVTDSMLRALSVSEILRRVKQKRMIDHPVDETDVREALAVLEGLGFTAPKRSALGAGTAWEPTAEGVLFRERNLP